MPDYSKAMLDVLKDGFPNAFIFALDRKYCYTLFNEKHRHEMKKVWRAEIEIGASLLVYMSSLPATRDAAKISIDRAFSGESFIEIQDQPETNLSYELNWYPVFDSEHVVNVLSVVIDVSDRKRREELELFAHTINHDLKAPLRAIAGFSRMVSEDYSAVLGDEGQRLLSIVTDNATRLDAQISAIHALSLISCAVLHKAPIDMASMAKAMFFEIASDSERQTISLNVDNLPNVEGDSTYIRKVWANLLSNAIKFTANNNERKIDIYADISDTEIKYLIRDNGVGFDPTYTEKLFRIFSQLHSQQDYPGTGAGLAIIKKIVEMHGGRVGAESGKNEGAIFSFTLPRRT